MRFSVVIPAHNAGSVIAEQLSALANQVDAGPFEVLVVDNMSTDGTVDVARGFEGDLQLRIVSARDGRSASYARNVGIANATGEYIVFVDADDVADPHLLAAYRAKAPSCRIMGGHYDETRLNDPKVAAWRTPASAGGLPTAFRTVPFFLMGNAAIHRAVFDELGLFDEALTHGGEEIDFSIRARLAGYDIAWVPDAIVYYRHRTTLRGLARQFFDYGRAATYVYARYRDTAGLPRTDLAQTLKVARAVVPHVVDLGGGNTRRGEWVRIASFYGGEAVESLRQRVWHLGA
jgi:glycosyltransferase involved in cell wall biosynthesis